MQAENKVKQLALRVDRDLVRKISEIDQYLSQQSLYVRRSLSATIRFCVENQWLSMASIFREAREMELPEPVRVEPIPEPIPEEKPEPKKKKGKLSDNGKPAKNKRTRKLVLQGSEK